MFQRVVIVAGLLSLALPSLARASGEGVGPSGMHAVAPAQPAPPAPSLATLRQVLAQLSDTRALVQGSVSDAVAAQLEHLRATHSSSLLRR
jgi:hypothetical protein